MSMIDVRTKEVLFPVAKTLYGLFFEDINRSGDSGLYPEMLRNRTFEDSLLPGGTVAADDAHVAFTSAAGWGGAFNHGEGLPNWIEENGIPYTPIPAWYAQKATLELDTTDVLNPKRRAALAADFQDGGSIWNIGYAGISVRTGAAYAFCLFAKADALADIFIKLANADGNAVYAETSFHILAGGYTRYDAVLVSRSNDQNARLVIEAPHACRIRFGFVSLMPADTYNGHGLRRDLVEKLAALKPAFMRFPGGCIVEGFNRESMLRFSNMIGPVWERPTNWNLWAYNTTNGLGYHEWLQLCEDLDMKKMWVCNCGMSCQARNPEYLDDGEQAELLQEAIDAIEYATAPADSRWGRIRAAAGHPAPFGMDYVEIGNENHGAEYNLRYKKFYDELKKRYPDIRFIANTHTERDGLPTDIADEHFYNTPEFFAENTHQYDKYDRNGPEIFVGEYAVVSGQPGTLKAAIGESMFLLGMEKNQDIVTLAAYAPLFENIHFYNWYPNLICFDNTRSYGIPSYHSLRLLGANRGTSVVRTETQCAANNADIAGLFGIQTHKPGQRFMDVRVDGRPAGIAHVLLGGVTEDDGVYSTFEKPLSGRMASAFNAAVLASRTWAVFGDEPRTGSVLDIRAWFDGGITFTVFCRQQLHKNRVEAWAANNVRRCEWTIQDGASRVVVPRFMEEKRLAGDVPLELETGWHDFRIVSRADGFDVSVDGIAVQTARLDTYPSIECSADTDDDRILVKIANFRQEPDGITIRLDCDVAADYSAEVLTGEALAENSMERPENVAPVTVERSGAGRSFVYTAPAMSLNILKLIRK